MSKIVAEWKVIVSLDREIVWDDDAHTELADDVYDAAERNVERVLNIVQEDLTVHFGRPVFVDLDTGGI